MLSGPLLDSLNLNQNDGEVQVMVHLVQKYYKDKDFCIITPYDAQRAAIERQLKDDGLPWERVFNVDSFQGSSYPLNGRLIM